MGGNEGDGDSFKRQAQVRQVKVSRRKERDAGSQRPEPAGKK